MRYAQWVVLLAAATLAACGSKGHGAAQGGASSASSASGGSKPEWNTDASAEKVAKLARGDVDCPARIKTAARDAKAPVDDVVGVRPGITYEEAANVVLCTDKLMVVQPDGSRGFQIKTFGETLRQGFEARLAEAQVHKSSKQMMQEMQDDALARGGNAVRHDMKAGQSKWFVATMGAPGQERVISVAREEWFQDGKNPTMASVEQALLKKYGTPSRSQKAGGRTLVSWIYDPLGRPVTETSPLYNRCSGVSDPNGGVNLSPDCGLVVAAVVAPLPDNPDLSQFFQVGVVDQAGGYEKVSATERNLQQLDAQRRAQQVEAASRNASDPKL